MRQTQQHFEFFANPVLRIWLAVAASTLILASLTASQVQARSLRNRTPGIAWEAEAGKLTAPFVADQGYVSQPVDTGVGDGGRAVYPITITQPGTYVITAVVIAPDDQHNSFYVNIDGEPTDPDMIWDIEPTSRFRQRVVSWRGSEFSPQCFYLTEGDHELILVGHEADTRVDRLWLSRERRRCADQFPEDTAPTNTPEPSTPDPGTPITEPPQTQEPAPPPQEASLYARYVNAGKVGSVDWAGVTWEGDQAYAPGSWGHVGSHVNLIGADVASPVRYPNGGLLDEAGQYLHRSETFGTDFGYWFDVPNGDYVVTMRFAEPIWSAGERWFDVVIEGQTVLDNFDVAQEAGGPGIVVVRSFQVVVADQVLQVDFRGDQGSPNDINAFVKAISVASVGVPPITTPEPGPAPTEDPPAPVTPAPTTGPSASSHLELSGGCTGNCGQIWSQVCNTGAGAMTRATTWELLYDEGYFPWKGDIIGSGVVGPLAAGECQDLTFAPLPVPYAQYMFRVYQEDGSLVLNERVCELVCDPAKMQTPAATSGPTTAPPTPQPIEAPPTPVTQPTQVPPTVQPTAVPPTPTTQPTQAPPTPVPTETAPPPVAGNARYVAANGNNANSGTIDQPWQTVQYAADHANPGDTIYLRGGTYNESVRISRSGTAAAPIVLAEYPGESATINGGSSIALYTASAASYWTVQDLTIRSTNRYTVRLGWWYETPTTGWTVRRNLIYGPVFTIGSYHLFEDNEVDGTGYSHGLGDAGLADADTSHHNTFRNNYIHDFTNVNGRGIWTQGLTHDDLIEGNTIINIMGSGLGQCIDLDGAGNVEWRHVVRNNVVRNCSYVGIQLENVFASTVENNVIEDSGSAGIIVISYAANIGCKSAEGYGDTNGDNNCQGDPTNNILRQNLITKPSGSWGWGYGGIVNWYAGALHIWGNTIVAPYGGGNGAVNFPSPDYTVMGSTLRNNIIHMGSGNAVCLQGSFAPLAQDDHNLLFKSNGSQVYALGSSCDSRYSLPEYQAATGRGQGSVQAAPVFRDAQYHLQAGSPGIDVGVDVGIATDLDGVGRPQGAGFDMGAYEYRP